ncbi:MAG: hypothetical protein U0904_03830 [Candidatus Nanopelagicales bacterium]|nr:hypothetical protein [Candidatus Nanopelagicales bacterium]
MEPLVWLAATILLTTCGLIALLFRARAWKRDLSSADRARRLALMEKALRGTPVPRDAQAQARG